jgi:hypothetical protein
MWRCGALICSRSPLRRKPYRLGAVALLFVLAVLVLGEVDAWLVLYLHLAAIETTLILLGINLVIAIAFGLLAARLSPSRAEHEALQVRQQSLDAARGMLSLAALVPFGNTLLRHWRNNRALVRR